MKSFTYISLLFFLTVSFSGTQAQPQKIDKSSSIGWFISPEVGGIFHEDHIGRTVGVSLGLSFFRGHLKVGFYSYGPSGPINPQTFMVEASDGQSYKGSSTLRLRADHGVFGLLVAPSFNLGKIRLELPLAFGGMGAGYYLFGEDRNTPDNRRVSEWENQLMDERDAGFGNWLEAGVRLMIPMRIPGTSIGAGIHYTQTPGWESYVDPSGSFYNNRLRFSLAIEFASS